jgi:hypothetical protein
MLWEGKIHADNPEVCNQLLRGLTTMHLSHLIATQQWAMTKPGKIVSRVKALKGKQISEELRKKTEKQVKSVTEYLEEQQAYMTEFLEQLDIAEAGASQEIKPNRIRWALWDLEWRDALPPVKELDESSIPLWVEGLHGVPPGNMEFYSVNAPDPYLVRVEEEIIDAGKFLDVNVVTEAIAKEWSFMWEYFHPSVLFMTWLEA